MKNARTASALCLVVSLVLMAGRASRAQCGCEPCQSCGHACVPGAVTHHGTQRVGELATYDIVGTLEDPYVLGIIACRAVRAAPTAGTSASPVHQGEGTCDYEEVMGPYLGAWQVLAIKGKLRLRFDSPADVGDWTVTCEVNEIPPLASTFWSVCDSATCPTDIDYFCPCARLCGPEPRCIVPNDFGGLIDLGTILDQDFVRHVFDIHVEAGAPPKLAPVPAFTIWPQPELLLDHPHESFVLNKRARWTRTARRPATSTTRSRSGKATRAVGASRRRSRATATRSTRATSASCASCSS